MAERLFRDNNLLIQYLLRQFIEGQTRLPDVGPNGESAQQIRDCVVSMYEEGLVDATIQRSSMSADRPVYAVAVRGVTDAGRIYPATS
jgi:hypothetical protein